MRTTQVKVAQPCTKWRISFWCKLKPVRAQRWIFSMKNRRRDPVTSSGRQRSHQGHKLKSAPKESLSARAPLGSQESSAMQARIELAAIVESSDDAILSK